jgi:uncharacterized protein (TIGR02996 family)
VTTEDDFQTALDADPADWQTRLVFADWLQERGDPRADGYRALGTRRTLPAPALGRWFFTRDDASHSLADTFYAQRYPRFAESGLPADWCEVIRKSDPGSNTWNCTAGWFGYASTRRRAEDAAALAFAKLPKKRRAELLAGTGTEPRAAERTKKATKKPSAKGRKAKPKKGKKR